MHRLFLSPHRTISSLRAMATTATTGKGILMQAAPIAAAFRDEVKNTLAQCSVRPKLVGILATSAAPSKNYAEFTKKQCEELGFEFVLRTVGAAESPELVEGEGVEEAIIEANEDDSVDGIMVSFLSLRIRPWAEKSCISRCTILSLAHSRSVVKNWLASIFSC